MNAKILAHPVLHAGDERAADMVHMHVSQHQIGHGRKIAAGCAANCRPREVICIRRQ